MESKISSYNSEDVSVADKTEYTRKLKDISRKVEAVTDILDKFIFDAEEVGLDIRELEDLKSYLTRLMKENEKEVKTEIVKILNAEDPDPLQPR